VELGAQPGELAELVLPKLEEAKQMIEAEEAAAAEQPQGAGPPPEAQPQAA
jgi:hypothetical protein